MTDLIQWEQDKALYLFTSLTAGSSHVITATSRIETILKSARIPFSYIDTATNESAKKLYQRRGKGKKLPLLVKEGFVIADLEQVEDWNEFGELKEAIGPVATTATSHTTAPAKPPVMGHTAAADASYSSASSKGAVTGLEAPLAASSLAPSISDALRKAAFESANTAKQKKEKAVPAALSTPSDPVPPPPTSTPVTAPLASPTKVPLPASPLTKEPSSSIAEVASPQSGAPIASPPSRVASAGSSHSSHFVPEHFDPPATMHRGSSVSLASQEEIKEIESREAIQEEDEEDYEDAGAKLPEKKVESVESAKAGAVKTDETKVPAVETVKKQAG